MSAQTYFVRLADDHEVVGIFAASSIATLAYLVDQCTDPGICEYARAPEGGLYVGGPTPAKWPAPERDHEGLEHPDTTGLEDAEFDEAWAVALGLSNISSLRWKPLTAEAAS